MSLSMPTRWFSSEHFELSRVVERSVREPVHSFSKSAHRRPIQGVLDEKSPRGFTHQFWCVREHSRSTSSGLLSCLAARRFRTYNRTDRYNSNIVSCMNGSTAVLLRSRILPVLSGLSFDWVAVCTQRIGNTTGSRLPASPSAGRVLLNSQCD